MNPSEILRVATREYFTMMQKYIYYGVVDDYYDVVVRGQLKHRSL